MGVLTSRVLIVMLLVIAGVPALAVAQREDRPRGRGITVEELDEALEVLRRIEPDLAGRIDQWKKQKPEEIVELVNRQFPRLRSLLDTKRREPEMYELRVEDMRLGRESLRVAQKYRALEDRDSAEARKLREQYRKILDQHFEIRQRIRQQDVERLERRIAEIRQAIEDNLQRKDRVLDDEVKKLDRPDA